MTKHRAPGQTYDRAFYAAQAGGSERSAEIVVPLLLQHLRPQSVIDIGCGTGTWLATFRAHGVTRVLGIDGPWVPPSELRIPAESFLTRDLTAPMELTETFDLALSLEVAEHLPPAYGATLVATLVSLAPMVLFSAAIPGQGGADHVNESWQSSWAQLFAQHGYDPIDLVRPAVWTHPEVEFWYAQNALLYVAASARQTNPALQDLPAWPLDVVHPRQFASTIAAWRMAADPRRAGFTSLLRALPAALRLALERRLAPPPGEP